MYDEPPEPQSEPKHVLLQLVLNDEHHTPEGLREFTRLVEAIITKARSDGLEAAAKAIRDLPR